MAAIDTFEYGGKHVAVNLTWQVISAKKLSAGALYKLADQYAATDAVVRQDWYIDIGLCALASSDRKKGLYSLASMVHLAANKKGFPAHWIGVFDLPNGASWLLAVSENAIMPLTDVAGSKDDIAKLYGELTSEITRPRRWDRQITDMSLSDMLSEVSKDIYAKSAIKPIKTPQQVSRAKGGIYALIALGVAAYLFYPNISAKYASWRESQNPTPIVIDVPKIIAIIKPSIESRVTYASNPFAGRVVNTQLLAGCSEGLTALVRKVLGWTLVDATCDANTIQANYTRGAGAATVNKVSALLNGTPNQDGTSISVMRPRGALGATMEADTESKLVNFDVAALTLIDGMQGVRHAISISKTARDKSTYRSLDDVPKDLDDKVSPVISPYDEGSFVLPSTYQPTYFNEVLSQSGVVVQKITMTVQAGSKTSKTFTINGKLYGL